MTEQIPHEKGLDNSLALLRDGYVFVKTERRIIAQMCFAPDY